MGGARNSGTVYRLTHSGSGWTEDILFSFTGRSDGLGAVGGVVFDKAGNLYGTTQNGGVSGGGTVFELSPSGGGWNFTVLYSLSGQNGPLDSLALDAAGNLYGTTYADGAYGYGSVFKLTRNDGNWSYTDLHDFTNGDDGGNPIGERPDETVAATALNSEGESRSNPDDTAEGGGDQKAESTSDASKTANVAPAPRLPKDRYIAPEMKSWTPVFHVGHQLLIPTAVNDSKPMLFLIDTGSGLNFLSTRAGRQVTKISSDPNVHVKGLSGTVADVYRADKATLRFSHFSQKNQDIVTFDLSKISKHTGIEVSGVLGFQLLQMLQVKIDYR